MKQQWQRLAQKVDAMTLRERAIAFAMVTLVSLFMVDKLWIDPQFVEQKKLTRQMQENRNKTQEIRDTMQRRMLSNSADPDAIERDRLQALRQQRLLAHNELQQVQQGLVAPEKMAGLLEDILKRHGGLRLVGLKTLPAAPLVEPPKAEKTSAAVASAPAPIAAITAGAGQVGLGAAPTAPQPEENQNAGLIYKHGVEITLQGSYHDVLRYMAELESMPWQVYWGKARFEVDQHPNASLTLTLYTLSLDKKWLHL